MEDILKNVQVAVLRVVVWWMFFVIQPKQDANTKALRYQLSPN